MNLTESLSILKSKMEELSLFEAKGHLDHPEDLVFLGGSQGATNAVNATSLSTFSPSLYACISLSSIGSGILSTP